MVKYKYNEMNGAVSVFIAKLWALTDDKNTDQLIAWGQTGLSFIVFHPNIFAKQVLPNYFKHNNMTSFVRQLNMYGFKKIANLEQGSLSSDDESLEFYHPYFIRGSPQLLEHIKRKPTFKSDEPKNTAICQVLSDVNLIKSRQINLEKRMEQIKLENTALWDEVLYLRDKHSKQQLIVKKLIQFLLAIISNTPNFKLKDFPYMFNNAYYNLDRTNRLKAVQQEKQELHNFNSDNVIKFMNSPNSIYPQTNELNNITTNMGLPSEGIVTDMDLTMEQDHLLDTNNGYKGQEVVSELNSDDQLMNVPSPLLEVEVNSSDLNTQKYNFISNIESSNFDMLDEVSLAKNLLNKNLQTLKFQEQRQCDNIVGIQEKLPKALLDHIINFATDCGESPSKHNADDVKGKLNKNVKHQADLFLNIDHAKKASSSNSNIDMNESILNDLMVESFNASSNNEQTSSSLIVANKDTYRNEFNLYDLQNFLSTHNLSIDTRLLMDILSNIENTEILPTHSELGNQSTKDITGYKVNKEGINENNSKNSNIPHPNDQSKENQNIADNTNLEEDSFSKQDINIYDYPYEDDYVMMDSLPFLNQDTFSPSLSGIVAATLTENNNLHRLNSTLRTPLLSPDPMASPINISYSPNLNL